MNRRRKQDMARQIVAIRDVQKLISEQARQAADGEVDRQEKAVAEHIDRLGTAEAAWEHHLASGPLVPELVSAFSGVVVDHEQSCQTERQKLRWAEHEQDLRKRDVAARTGLRDQAVEMLKQARRKNAAAIQERAQSDLEERTTYEWRRG